MARIEAYDSHSVGAEIMNRIRLSAYLNTYGDKDETCGVGLSAGFVFGGSRMENKEWNTYHFEFEPFFGISSGALLLGLEARYNFDKPWDIGINIAICVFIPYILVVCVCDSIYTSHKSTIHNW